MLKKIIQILKFTLEIIYGGQWPIFGKHPLTFLLSTKQL